MPTSLPRPRKLGLQTVKPGDPPPLYAAKPWKSKGQTLNPAGKNKIPTDPNKPLTARQKRYVHFLVNANMSHSAAMEAAGFGASTRVSQWLQVHPAVQKAIAEAREECARVSQMTKKRVIDGFLEAIEMARLKADPMVMVAGWREVARMCGFYEPTRHKLDVSVDGHVVIQKLQQLDDAQLLALADGRVDALEGEFEVVSTPAPGNQEPPT